LNFIVKTQLLKFTLEKMRNTYAIVKDVAGVLIAVTCLSICISCAFQIIIAVFQYLQPIQQMYGSVPYQNMLFLFLYEMAKVA